MPTELYTHELKGCRPTPLAYYLKALAALRLVSEQADADARGCWKNDVFMLRTKLSRDELSAFFLERYAPTPIVAPWNGGSGFYKKDNTTSIDLFLATEAERFAGYRETIEAARATLAELGITEKPAPETKIRLLQACRGQLPDAALQWLDAAFLLTDSGAKYPPLLGTGGNDGRLEFTNNFMQRLLDIFDSRIGSASQNAENLWRASLFDDATDALQKGSPIGQFLPTDAGGPNAEAGFSADSLINPWDFVLMLEGAAMFASAAVRRLENETSGALSYPFTVRQVGVGYASAAEDDEASARAEIWMPLWAAWASNREIHSLFAEGRARVGARSARNGVDFARAVAELGVDRGIHSFQRYGFQVRNGLSYFAVPLSRFVVEPRVEVRLLTELDRWLDKFRRAAGSKTAPASAHRALRRLEAAIMDLCQHGDALRTQAVLVALGHCEQVMATCRRWTEDSFLKPVTPLRPQWLQAADDGSAEFRLALSLASLVGRHQDKSGKGRTTPLRQQMEPVATWPKGGKLGLKWDFEAGREVAWSQAPLVQAMNDVLQRRLLHSVQAGAASYSDAGLVSASLADVALFIEGHIDERHFLDLLWGFLLVDWVAFQRSDWSDRGFARNESPGSFYALMKCCFAGQELPRGTPEQLRKVAIPITPPIHRLASAGNGSAAAQGAVRRLRGSGLVPAVPEMQVQGLRAQRVAAAVLFPVGSSALRFLADSILRPERLQTKSDKNSQPTSEESV